MKPYYLLGSNGVVRYFLLLSLFLCLAPVKAQLSNGKIAAGKAISQRQANTRHATGDTLAFHRFNKRFQVEVAKRGELDMSLRL